MASAEDPQDPPAQPPTAPVQPVEPKKPPSLQLKSQLAEEPAPLQPTNESQQQLIDQMPKQVPTRPSTQESKSEQAQAQAQAQASKQQAARPEALQEQLPESALQQQQKPPPSPFVSKLRGEVEFVRSTTWDQNPSVGTWLTPRGTKRVGENGTVVKFAEGSTPRPWRQGPTELKFKGTGTKPFKLDKLPSGISVWDVKALCERYCGLPPDSQRLLHKGKILQDDHLLEDLELQNGATLFLVKGAQPASSSSSSAARVEEEARQRRLREQEEEKRREEERPSFEDMDEAHLMSILMMGRPCWECGVNPGRLQTDGMCSVCFREMVMRENAILKEKKREEERRKREEEEARVEDEKRKKEEHDRRQKDRTRCKTCSKKTGLTGFLCRCGYYFCATHRHAEDHECSFDHRAHGREILAQQNPGV